MFRTKVEQHIKSHILGSITFFPKNRTVSEIMRKNVAQPDKTQMTT